VSQENKPRSVADSIRRVVNIARIIGAVVLVGIVVTGIRSLVLFYSNEVGFSAPDAARLYTEALLEGDLDTVYNMTDPLSLTDVYGRPVSRTVFMAEARELIGSEALAVETVEAVKLFDRDGVHYYRMDVTFQGGGTTTHNRLLLALRNEEGTWRVVWPFGLSA